VALQELENYSERELKYDEGASNFFGKGIRSCFPATDPDKSVSALNCSLSAKRRKDGHSKARQQARRLETENGAVTGIVAKVVRVGRVLPDTADLLSNGYLNESTTEPFRFQELWMS
jgi:hypothetical protein